MFDTVIIYALGLLVFGLVAYFFIIYNGLVVLKNNIEKSWSNIDVLLKQRHDELTNVIETVKGYMNYEKDVLLKVTEARTSAIRAQTVGEKAAADEFVRESLKTLFAVAEKYPDLKANQNFMQLQGRITGLENEIADRREFYNDSVTNYNIRIASLPDVFVARILSYQPKSLFKATDEDRKRIDVKFT
jgi:LemA protein